MKTKVLFLSCLAVLCAGVFALPLKAQSLDVEWVSQIGGSGGMIVSSAIVSDLDKNVYVAGRFQDSIEATTVNGPLTIYAKGKDDLFIAKLNPSGVPIWVKQVGGSGASLGLYHEQDWALNPYFSMVIDQGANLYISGNFMNTVDFDPGLNDFFVTSNSDENAFILKLDQDGRFVWVRTFVGAHNSISALAIDTNDNVIAATGYFMNTVDFGGAQGGGTMTSLNKDARDVFVAKFDTSGSLLWSKQMGSIAKGTASSRHNEGLGIAISKSGSIYTTGVFTDSADFDPGPGMAVLTSTAKPAPNVFVSKLDNDGNLLWARAMGSLSNNGSRGSAIATDELGNVYTTGYYQGTASFDPTHHTTISSSGMITCFISKLDSSGNFVWVRDFERPVGKQGADHGKSIRLDEKGNSYTVGYFTNEIYLDPDRNNGNRTVFKPGSISSNSFIVKLDPQGNYEWGRHITSNKQVRALAVHVGSSKNVYAGGFFTGAADFDPMGTAVNRTAFNSDFPPDGYVVKFACLDTSLVTLSVEECTAKYELNGVVYTADGVYEQSFENASGCDSVIRLDLKLNAIMKPIISVDEFVLSTSAQYVGYQWLLNGSVLPNEKAPQLIVEENGDYSVVVWAANGCMDTSEIYKVTNVTAVSDLSEDQTLKIYPNPAKTEINIDAASPVTSILSTVSGQPLMNIVNEKRISIEGLPNGIYFLRVFDKQGTFIKVEKIIKVN